MPNARTNEINRHRLNKHRPLGLYAVPPQAKAAVRIFSSVYRDKEPVRPNLSSTYGALGKSRKGQPGSLKIQDKVYLIALDLRPIQNMESRQAGLESVITLEETSDSEFRDSHKRCKIVRKHHKITGKIVIIQLRVVLLHKTALCC